MKAKFFAIAIALISICTTAKAQGTTSINIGVAPFGHIHENITLKDEKYKYDFKSYFNANFGIEKQLKGVSTLSEFKYSKGEFDSYELKGESKWFNPRQAEDVYTVSFTQYGGHTINANKRIQFPLYIGVGLEYINGGPFHNLILDGAAKARVKFFFTNHIGIFAGVTGRIGWGGKKAHEESSSSSETYSIINTQWSADAGLTIGF